MNIKEVNNNTDEFDTSKLELEISGSNVNYSLINSLRKMCINQIPTYAFHATTINITKNTSLSLFIPPVFDDETFNLNSSESIKSFEIAKLN